MITKSKADRTLIDDDDSLETEFDDLEEGDGCEKDEYGHLILHVTVEFEKVQMRKGNLDRLSPFLPFFQFSGCVECADFS